ncbi:uncharacterized protein LOC102806916 [Saccoglossus kowalevskii]|uniref:Uncharacterized protein LOC102806916 n=1 Tax=Saccoglossus kowalevskii TaxID=10224 RepID=A0ABM0MKW7_SACKO|nr:PREDICTED: uncharacterized protein LOC102806916 [Saccoglossus kowalevskii]
MGQRDKLSAADVLLANLIYNCSAGPKVSTESTFQADTQCVSPYKVNSQASLMWASSVLPDVGDTEEYWVDGNITNNYIWFSDGSEMVVESTLFHLNEPSGRGHCIQLRFKNGYWALEDNSCNHKQKYICSAMPVISSDMEVFEFAHIMCSSGSLYQITDLATLERAQVAIATNGIDGKVWVDGHKDNNTITFTGGSTIAANPALFHQNGNNGSGSCLILEFSIDGWKLNAVKCDSFEHYLCVG